jgi:hypothetical protein
MGHPWRWSLGRRKRCQQVVVGPGPVGGPGVQTGKLVWDL